jgi:DNA invertase Pin-like site-specific DNA recombinase
MEEREVSVSVSPVTLEGNLDIPEGTQGIVASGGKLVPHIFDTLAEFEREIIKERAQAGLQAARITGRRGGRQYKLTEKQVEIVRQLYYQSPKATATTA